MTQHTFIYFVKYLAGFLSLLLAGCTSSGWLTRTDLSHSYTDPGRMAVAVFKVNDSLLEIVSRVPEDWVTPLAGSHRLLIRHNLFNSFKDSRLIDSLSFLVSDSNQSTIYPYHTCRVRSSQDGTYVLKSDFTDVYGKKETSVITVSSHPGKSLFRAETSSGDLLVEKYLPVNKPVRILSSDLSEGLLYCRGYFHHNQELIPPYVDKGREAFDYKADTGFILPLTSGKTDFITLEHPGFYFFQTDTLNDAGFTIVAVHRDFPAVTTPWLMLEPMQYLTSAEEFERMVTGFQGKATVDSFWITSTGNAVRAVGMIRKYYHRVEDANVLFTSFCEGWKTDRGMIYLMFGPPNVVYRSDTEEVWTYGEISNNRSMRFIFLKVMNRFTENDFILYRQASYKPYWYNAVRQWRR